MGQAFEGAENDTHDPVPVHLRDTSYKGAGRLGSGEGYKYPHDYEGHYVEQVYAPLSVQGKKYYKPSEQGFEKRIKELQEEREKQNKKQSEDKN